MPLDLLEISCTVAISPNRFVSILGNLPSTGREI